jgi:CubicO group peptidase (beta-lactamase class C family)
MMLNDGAFNGVRLLGKKTVELMRSNSIGDNYNYWRDHFGDKFGYGFSIRTERGEYDQLESLGAYSWGGIFYTRFWIDPKENMITIFLTQYDVDGQPKTARAFRVLAYQALID